MRTILDSERLGITLYIYMKKDDDESSDFYYVGEAKSDPASAVETRMSGNEGLELPVVHMNLHLAHPVEHSLYHYLTAKEQ